ncbi:amidohydrolase family protein [Starkeya sp. ORNL1]|uniref:amidohydrolase family protein n=1 Tax=Starkeya sp. ORNL1 TaxID=2709380 RepID=UPI001463EAB8|nr:amidohydrolase family protein [Starkeya sp. ORNL1]QJP16864.1 amidohydrolase family protein [Starkeya sp. ORNL1]
MIIDAHTHVWSGDVREYPWQPILAHVPPPTIAAPVEMLLADMDSAGVDRVVLVQPSVYGWDNRYLMACLAAWPQRFVGICLIDPRSTRPYDDLARWCGPGGCKGLRFNLIRQGDASWLAADERRPLFEAVAAHRLSLSFHMDIDQAPVIAALAARYPSTPFIVDYLGAGIHGRTDAVSYLDLLAARENVCFKLLCVAEDARTPYPFADIIPFYSAVLERFGAARTMFGSDYPGVGTVCSYADAIAWGANFPGLTGRERDLVMGGTAARILGISPPEM